MTMPKAKNTNVTDVLLGAVVDKSGSMGHLAAATREGFNSLLAEQRAVDDGRCLLSMIQFDDQFYPTVIATDVREVPDLDATSYAPSGGTALYDAVAAMIDGIEAWLANHPGQAVKVIIIAVWTDGEENSSRGWTLDRLNARIADRKANGWEFMFLGTGSAAWTEGQNFARTVGVANNAPVMATSAGTSHGYAAMSHTVTATRSSGHTPTALASFAMTSASDGTSGLAAGSPSTSAPHVPHSSAAAVDALAGTDDDDEG